MHALDPVSSRHGAGGDHENPSSLHLIALSKNATLPQMTALRLEDRDIRDGEKKRARELESEWRRVRVNGARKGGKKGLAHSAGKGTRLKTPGI